MVSKKCQISAWRVQLSHLQLLVEPPIWKIMFIKMIASFPLNKITSWKNKTCFNACYFSSGTQKINNLKVTIGWGSHSPAQRKKTTKSSLRQGAEFVLASAGLCGAGARELVEPPCVTVEHRTPKLGPQRTQRSHDVVWGWWKNHRKPTWATEKNTGGPLLSIESWLFNRDPYNGLLWSPCNWV